jgi:Oligosaccharide biosynthesis protein Alg14 like
MRCRQHDDNNVCLIRHIQHTLYSNKDSNEAIIHCTGGHTTEILKLVSVLSSDKYHPRHYVVADTDILSSEKIKQVEGQKETNARVSYACCVAILCVSDHSKRK